jgi:enamine deaminase RidA (YjgF/YER057c/UK114 family)
MWPAMGHKLVPARSQWAADVGYSRAVRVGRNVYVAGTAGIGEDGEVSGDARAQTLRALEIIRLALTEAGAELSDVVRTRIFVTDIGQWEAIGRAHGEVFGAVRPAATMIEVKRLIHPDMLVEIEADAVIEEG